MHMIKIPFCRFDGKEFLTKHKGKKIMFVGDSVSLNQWQSLICLLRSSVPQTELLELGDLKAYNYTFPVSDISLHKHFSDCANFFSLFPPTIWSNHNYNAAAGLPSFSHCFSYYAFGWHWSGKNWSSPEAWLPQEWKHMERHGHRSFQHLALMVPHRTWTTVRFLQNHLLFVWISFSKHISLQNSLK